MEDEHICVDNLLECLGPIEHFSSPGAFYGVFDGYGGVDAALFIRENILQFILKDAHFPIYLSNGHGCRRLEGRLVFLHSPRSAFVRGSEDLRCTSEWLSGVQSDEKGCILPFMK
ncbi:hypothetical protein F2P56_013739 [Juglans regia]|uniref:Uncharacterized protein n=1 Tax=Juglans regia TaxID=51240 RepID=A0A833XQY7_JUGRE|nr:hypothetical protein F2P56_013739 [Juglans regia]